MDDERAHSGASSNQANAQAADDDLVRAIAAGDEHALRELYDRHAPWLAVRLRRTLPVSAVEDVLQETFLAAWRGAGRYRATGEGGAWLWGIARRQAALWLRRQGQFDRAFDDARGLSQAVQDDATHDAITRLDLQQAFAAAGPPGSPGRDLARRVFLRDQPLAEIAADLEIPTGTVKSRLHKLRKAMHQAMGSETER